jgi:tetratricopeptide (TPR) repeat protein
MTLRWCSSVAIVVASCSAPATLLDLQNAERAERSGDHDKALLSYRSAQQSCRQLTPKRRRDLACVQAHLGEAELLERDNRFPEAIAAYRAMFEQPDALAWQADPSAVVTPGDPMPGAWARAGYRQGALLLASGDATQAYATWWRVVTTLPNEGSAGDVLGSLVRDARVRNPDALINQLGDLVTPLAETGVADNLLWWLADLSERERHDPIAARSYYDRIYSDYPTSGMRDDARWHAARLSRALGDANGAVARLRGLLATREVAFGTGSYFSVWLDNAQLELGRVLRDELSQPDAALAAFAQLPKDYPASTLRDDALYEIAATLHSSNEPAKQQRGCLAWATLRKKFPDSKYLNRGSEFDGCGS